MNQIEKDARFLLDDIEAHNGRQSTWDYDADYRFARYCNDIEAIKTLEKIYRSHAPGPFILTAHDVYCRKVKQRRLRALRNLKKEGHLGSFYSGFTLYGDLIRTNEYYLLSDPPWWVKELKR